jgi:hypothetical protein
VGLLVAPDPPGDPEPPPVELLPEPPAEVPPPAEEPPELPLPELPVAPLAPLPDDASEGLPDSLAPLASVLPLPVLLDEVFVELVALVAADAWASFSADVLVGGMMFGVFLGTASEALEPPPHALRVTAQRASRRLAAAAAAAREGAIRLPVRSA